jgi:uncharacterized repeat protein (TIGR03803 family)
MTSKLKGSRAGTIASLAIMAIWAAIAAPPIHAQTYTVLHTFSGPEGANPENGVTIDQAGNLYGTTAYGGNDCDRTADCGTVFRLQKSGADWTFASLYRFQPSTNGFGPSSRVFIGPDGTLYGATAFDRRPGCFREDNDGCGVIYRL